MYVTVAALLSRASSWSNDHHTTPSVSCCAPKRPGTSASGSSAARRVILTVATPATVSVVPAATLASNEKHMVRGQATPARARETGPKVPTPRPGQGTFIRVLTVVGRSRCSGAATCSTS